MKDDRSCGFAPGKLLEVALGDAAEPTRHCVEEHVAGCADCRVEMDRMRASLRAYRDLGQESTAWNPGVTDPATRREPFAAWLAAGAGAWRFGVAVAAAAVLAAALWLLGDAGSRANGGRPGGEGFRRVDGPLVEWGADRSLLLEPPAGSVDEQFGTAIALDADTLVVSAVPGARRESLGRGTAHVYVYQREPTGWRLAEVVEGPAAEPFGEAVALSQQTLAVGNPSAGDPRVYLYRRGASGWHPDGVVGDPNAERGSDFGRALALQGDWLIVGARRAGDVGGTAVGRVFVYRRTASGWQPAGELVPDVLVPKANFGYAVAIDGDRVIVGARGEDYDSVVEGSVFFFELRDGRWQQVARFGGGRGAADFLGVSVAVEGDLAVAGAEYPRDTGGAAGAIHTYRRVDERWIEGPTVTHADGDRVWLGRDVALSAGMMVSGARRTPGALRYRWNGLQWIPMAMIAGPSSLAGFDVGTRVALGDGVLALTAWPPEPESGHQAVVVYRSAAAAE